MEPKDKAKQEVIQEAWVSAVGIERYEGIKDELVLDGFIHFQPSSLIDTDTKIIDGLPFYRPKSLSGIETNNGWIRIESEADLPYFTVWLSDGKDIWQGNLWTVNGAHRMNLMATHYQPIIKPLPPIY